MFIYLCELCKMCTREQCICIYLVMIVFVQVGNGSSCPADNVDKDWGNPAEAKIVDSGSFCLWLVLRNHDTSARGKSSSGKNIVLVS